MTDFETRDRSMAASPAEMAMLLLQVAASRAEIGPFARQGRETPQAAARLYRLATSPVRDHKLKLA